MALTEAIGEAQKKAAGAAERAGNLAAGEYTIPDKLKAAALKAYKDNQDIIKPLDVATSQYLTSPQEARTKFQGIFNPFSREELVSKYVSNKSLPMLSLASILGQRMGRFEDVIGTGTRAYQAQTAAAQGAAELARQNLADLLDQYQLEESRRRWEIEQGSTTPSLEDMLDALKGEEGEGEDEHDEDFYSRAVGSIKEIANQAKGTAQNILNAYGIQLPTVSFSPTNTSGGIISKLISGIRGSSW
jgi:hypothetical protein